MPRRTREERGLLNDDGLRDLAKTYLETQGRLWPNLKSSGLLPKVNQETIARLAADFKRRFLAKEVAEFRAPEGRIPWRDLAAAYLRFSDPGSNPRSLNQQLHLALERAQQNGHFIPWEYVFADAGVTGTIAARTGYQLAKGLLERREQSVGILYIDEIGRASRDAVEALQLGRLIDQQKKRLIGVSDGFDSALPTSKLLLSMFGMLQEWYVDQLRLKVLRGQCDAFRRGTNTGQAAPGYRLVPAIDHSGRPITGKGGRQVQQLEVDPDEAKWVRHMFELYAEKGWSRSKIAREFNQRGLLGPHPWNSGRVQDALSRHKYVGVNVFHMRHTTFDSVTGKGTTRVRPRCEWMVRRARGLQIVPWHLWKKAQKRLATVAEAYSGRGRVSRSDVYPTRLIRPRCGSCGSPLVVGHSGHHYSYCCPNGRLCRNGCTLKGYKSIDIVERVILGFLKNRVLTTERVTDCWKKANAFLAEQSKLPKPDVAPIHKEIRSITEKINRTYALIEGGDGELESARVRIRAHEKRLHELRAQLQAAEAKGAPPPGRLDLKGVQDMVADLRGLLEQDVAQAAPILRELTGPIAVEQVHEPGKTRPTWFATFTFDLVPVMLRLARGRLPITAPLDRRALHRSERPILVLSRPSLP